MFKSVLKILIVLCLGMVFVATDLHVPFVDQPSVAEAQEKKKKKRGFFQRLFGGISSDSRKPKKKKQQSTKRVKKVTPVKPQNTTLPKIDDANQILVLGDDTAAAIARGLTESYKRTPSVVVSPRVTPSIAIIGDAFYNWLDASDFAFVGERTKAVVVALGTHDRDHINTPGGQLLFGSGQWRRAYVRRLVDVAAQLQLMQVPVIWVLPPPVIDDEHTERAARIGEIQNATFHSFNFNIVDVAGGFTNDVGEYRQSGTSLKGSRVLLRLNNGIGFTRRGEQKLAHYVRREIDLILDDSLDNDFVLQGGTKVPRVQSQKVVILTRPAIVQGAKLAGGNGRVSAFYRDKAARDYFVKGKAPDVPKGRADNFKWTEKASSSQ